MQLLDLGTINIDSAYILAGANQFPAKSGPQPHTRRDLVMIAALLFHPDIGLILFDTGSCEDLAASWGDEALEIGPITRDKATQGLPEAIKATGAGTIEDIRVVVLSHLHCDHAGGLEHFFRTGESILSDPRVTRADRCPSRYRNMVP
jgi:glyoxylase-like metal-dependent hydrolase (beta-lactamase superfamily II)